MNHRNLSDCHVNLPSPEELRKSLDSDELSITHENGIGIVKRGLDTVIARIPMTKRKFNVLARRMRSKERFFRLEFSRPSSNVQSFYDFLMTQIDKKIGF